MNKRRITNGLALAMIGFAVIAITVPESAYAWNPIKSVVRGVKKVGSTVGGILGSPAGGFVEASTTPTIRSAEASALRVTADLDKRMKERMGDVDAVLAERIGQADIAMEARILQLQVGLDDVLASNIGRVDDVARQRIAQLDETLRGRITQLDENAENRINQLDSVLAARTDQVNLVIAARVDDLDERLKARIEQVDQIAETRIGNIDIVATKASLTFEQSLIRVLGAGCLIIFIAFLVWRLFVSGRLFNAQHPESTDSLFGTMVRGARENWKRVGSETALAGIGLLLLYAAVLWLPGGAKSRVDKLETLYVSAYDQTWKEMDLDRARFLSAQLQALNPTSKVNRSRYLKAELMRDLLVRPALVQSIGGINEVVSRVNQLEAYASDSDPDIPAIKAFVLWQIAADRGDELEVANLAAEAIARAQHSEFDGFFMLPIMHSYLDAYVAAPLPQTNQQELARMTKLRDESLNHLAGLGPDKYAPIAHIVEYNNAVLELDRSASQPYVDMLKAHADVVRLAAQPNGGDSPLLSAAKQARLTKAREVVAAWAKFDATLRDNPFLQGTSAPLAAFELNDAVLVTALWFESNVDSAELPPLLTTRARELAGQATLASELFASLPETPASRLQFAPLRIAWQHRYAGLFGAAGRDLVAFEESNRFGNLEKVTREFEHDYIRYLTADRSDGFEVRDRGTTAAVSAARLGLYTFPAGATGERVPFSGQLVTDMVRNLPTILKDEFERDEQADLESKTHDQLLARRLRVL